MIVPNDSKQALVSADGIPPSTSTEEQPPPYGTSLSPSASSSGDTQEIQPLASNFVSISRGGHPIKGRFLIDPELIVPPQFLPPLAKDETEDTRRNLLLSSRDGRIDVDVTVLTGIERGTGNLKAPVRMKIDSRDGRVIARIRDTTTPSPSLTLRRPYHISIYSADGALYIYLPRSFRGLCTIKTHDGHVKFSSGMQANVRVLSELKNEMRAFVGDWEGIQEFSGSTSKQLAEDLPVGDALEADTRDGNVYIFYVDEEIVRADNDGGRGFWSRLFRG